MRKISIVIPVLNESKVIKGCLRHLLNQSNKPFEVIIVDNGCSDNTMAIMQNMIGEFKSKKINLHAFCYPEGNQTNARDFGVRKAKGEIVGFLDADSFADKNWILNLEKYFDNDEIVGIGGKSTFRNRGKIFNFLYMFGYYYLMIFINWYCIGGGNSAFRKSAFVKVRGYTGLEKLRKEKKLAFPEDDFFLSKKMELVGRLKFCRDVNVTLLQRIRNDKTKTSKKNNSFIKTLKKVYDIILDHYKIIRYLKDKNQ